MEEENLTTEAQPSAENIPAEGGEPAVSDSGSLTLEEINAITGKTYKSKESALKSIKDMNSMAGKAADKSGKVPDEVTERIKALELDNFYARNPQHETNREILEALAEKNGVTIAEATTLPAYQKIAGAVETRAPRTVADTNSRVAVTKEKTVNDVASTGNADEMAKYLVDTYILKN